MLSQHWPGFMRNTGITSCYVRLLSTVCQLDPFAGCPDYAQYGFHVATQGLGQQITCCLAGGVHDMFSVHVLDERYLSCT